MKKIIGIAVLLFSVVGVGAQSYTPNCNLFLPPQGYQPWTTPMNQDLTLIDDCLGVLQNAFQGVWSNSTIYAQYQQVSYNGSLYISLQSSNYDQNPVTAITYWQLYLTGVAGSVSAGTAGQLAYYPASGTTVAGMPTALDVSKGGTGAGTAPGAALNIMGATITGTLGTSSQVSTFPGTVAAGTTVLGCPTTSTVAQCIANLPATGGIVQLNQGTYISGYSEISGPFITMSNVTIFGSGIPQIGSTGLISGTGTIVQGPILIGANNFSVYNLGVNVGPAVITAQFGGTGQDGISTEPYNSCGIANCQWQNWHLENIAVIGNTPSTLNHAVVLTGVNNLVIKNLHTQFNTHGLATNGSSNVSVDGLYGTGHSSDCWIIKTGDAMTVDTTNVSGYNINCSYYATQGVSGDTGWGVYFQAESGGNIVGTSIDGLNCEGMRNDCIYTQPISTFNVVDTKITHVLSQSTYGPDVSTTSSGSGGLTAWFDLSDSNFQNGSNYALSIGAGTTNANFHDLDIYNAGGVAGIYNGALGATYTNINFEGTVPGNRFIYNDAPSSMSAHHLTYGGAPSSTYFVLNVGNYSSFYNGCSFPANTPIYGEFFCNVTAQTLTGPPGAGVNAVGGTGSAFDFNVAPVAGGHNNFTVLDSGNTITYGTVAAGSATPTTIGSTGVTFPDSTVQASKGLLPANNLSDVASPSAANLNITGVTQTGTLGTSSQVSTFPGTVAATTSSLALSTGSVTPSADDTSILIHRAAVNPLSSGGSHAVRDESTYAVPSGTGGYASFDSIPTMSGGLAYNHMHSFQSRPFYTGTNTVSEISGVTYNLNQTGSGTVGNSIGLNFLDALGTGPITQQIGVLCGYLTRGVSNFCITSYGTTPSKFNGYVIQGDTVLQQIHLNILPTGAGTTGGAMAAGTYYVKISAIDGYGMESDGGPENATGVTIDGSTQTAITWTWTGSAYAVSYRVYVGTSTGAEASYFTVTAGIGGGTVTYTQTATTGTAGTPPILNKTGSINSNIGPIAVNSPVYTPFTVNTSWASYTLGWLIPGNYQSYLSGTSYFDAVGANASTYGTISLTQKSLGNALTFCSWCSDTSGNWTGHSNVKALAQLQGASEAITDASQAGWYGATSGVDNSHAFTGSYLSFLSGKTYLESVGTSTSTRGGFSFREMYLNGGANLCAWCDDGNGNWTAGGYVSALSHVAGGTTFTVAGCGTSTSLVGGATAGKFVAGSATCTPVITTGTTAPSGYSCWMNDHTTTSAKFQETASTQYTATFTATGTLGATDTIDFGCLAY